MDRSAAEFDRFHDAVAGRFSDDISPAFTTIVSENTQGTGPIALPGTLLASAGGSLSVTSSLIATSVSPITGQTGNTGDGASLSTTAIAISAPSSILLGPGQDVSKPETIAFDPFAGTRELAGSDVSAAVAVPAPAEAAGKAGGLAVIDFEGDVFLTNQAESASFAAPTVMSACAATDSDVDIAQTDPLTTTDSVSPIDPARAGHFTRGVGELLLMTTMLATHSGSLAFGGTVSNAGSKSWAARSIAARQSRA